MKTETQKAVVEFTVKIDGRIFVAVGGTVEWELVRDTFTNAGIVKGDASKCAERVLQMISEASPGIVELE